MANEIKPSELAEAAGISPSHASNILSGRRDASSDIALKAFRAFGVRLGLLAHMSDEDIAKLCSQSCAPATDIQGGDEVVHIADDNDGSPTASTGQVFEMSREDAVKA